MTVCAYDSFSVVLARTDAPMPFSLPDSILHCSDWVDCASLLLLICCVKCLCSSAPRWLPFLLEFWSHCLEIHLCLLFAVHSLIGCHQCSICRRTHIAIWRQPFDHCLPYVGHGLHSESISFGRHSNTWETPLFWLLTRPCMKSQKNDHFFETGSVLPSSVCFSYGR